jgi:hypothetical protein
VTGAALRRGEARLPSRRGAWGDSWIAMEGDCAGRMSYISIANIEKSHRLSGMPHDEDPWGIVARLMDAVSAGSYLTISHPAIDIHKSQPTVQKVYNENVLTAQTLRTRDETARFFTGLELVEPGLVQVYQWRPDPDDFAPEGSCPRTERWGANDHRAAIKDHPTQLSWSRSHFR